MSVDNGSVQANGSSDNNIQVEANIVKSAYAQYCEKRGVVGVGIYVDAKLIEAMDGAAKKAGMKRNEWLLTQAITAVNAAGFTYELPVAKSTKKLSAKEELAQVKAELEAMRAVQAKAQEELIALNTPLVPTPPTLKANPTTGKVEEKAA